MKQLVKLSLLLLAFMLPASAIAHDFEVDGIYYNINGNEATVTYRGTYGSQYSNEYTGNVIIPASVTYNGKTYSVTAIGDYAFYCCSGLTSITIPNSVKTIGDYAFDRCTALTSINIPNSVTTIGESAFNNTAWYNNQSDGVVYAGLVVYKYKGTMPDGTSITLRDGTLGIARSAFSCCTGLTSIIIPNSVTNIGFRTFYNCTGLTSINIPNSVTTIGGEAFHGCSSLTSVTIPNSVTTIGIMEFADCSGLTSVNIPNSVTTIGEMAFWGCSKLTSINIPNSVTTIGKSAFACCSSLAIISVASNNPTYDSRNNCNAIIETATNTLIAGCMNTTIPNSVTAIGYSAFSGCTGLTSINIPNSVTYIGDNAFGYCSGLTNVTIGNSVTTIGESAFCGCSGLTSVTIPNSVTIIGDNAFWDCSGLTRVTIGNSVSYIGDNAFGDCSGLTSVIIPNSVTAIGYSAFSGCTGLTSITIPNSVTTIGGNAFGYCSGLTSVNITDLGAWCHIQFSDPLSNPLFYAHHLYLNSLEVTDLVIPNSITSIGDNAFYGCCGLTSVAIPNSVTTIGVCAFCGCSGLTSVNIPNSVTTIGNWAFASCSCLTSITIPNSVMSIGEEAFEYCIGLTSVTCLATTPPTLAGSYVFDNSTYSNATLKVPQSSISAYLAADYWKYFTNIQGLADVFKVDGIYYRTQNYSTATVIPNPEGEGYYQGEVVIPDSITNQDLQFRVTGIENGAFDGCDELNSVVIGDAVETIGDEAFQGCTGLTSVTIGNGVTSIGQRAFNYCNALQTVTCLGTVPPVMANSNCFSSAAYRKATLKVHRNYIDTYTATNYWYKFENIEGFGSVGLGDANGDGDINIADVTTLIDQLLGKNSGSEFYFESADLNGNGHLDIGDVTTLIDLLLWSH